MKEHSFFLEDSFMEKDQDLKEVAQDFQNTLADILNGAVSLADGKISDEFLQTNEAVINSTLDAENKTIKLS